MGTTFTEQENFNIQLGNFVTSYVPSLLCNLLGAILINLMTFKLSKEENIKACFPLEINLLHNTEKESKCLHINFQDR